MRLTPTTTAATDPASARRAELLDAAGGVFLRYGYKKTSMDEVARAAGLSRPGLYLHFAAKDALFREAVARLLDRTLASGRAALADPGRTLEQRIVDGFAAVHGHMLASGVSGQQMAELIDSANALASEAIASHERAFRNELVRVLESAVSAGKARVVPRIAVPELAVLLDVISTGLKHRSSSLSEYRERFHLALRALCETSA